MADRWLSAPEFALLVGISRQRAALVLRSAWWNGRPLEVSTYHGCGGRSGINYRLKLSCLLPDLQARFNALQTPVEGGSNHLSGHGAERAWWLRILGPALDTPKGSPDRKAAFQRAIAETNTNWRGYPIKLTMRLLQRRMEMLEGGGIGALGRSGRADKGRARTVVSRQWDAAVPFSADTKARIAELLRHRLVALFKADFRFGQVESFGAKYLAERTEAASC